MRAPAIRRAGRDPPSRTVRPRHVRRAHRVRRRGLRRVRRRHSKRAGVTGRDRAVAVRGRGRGGGGGSRRGMARTQPQDPAAGGVTRETAGFGGRAQRQPGVGGSHRRGAGAIRRHYLLRRTRVEEHPTDLSRGIASDGSRRRVHRRTFLSVLRARVRPG